MTVVDPRPASTVCLLRPDGDRVEVLMVRRSTAAEFMAGSFVFPGGGVDDCDHGEMVRSVVIDDRPEDLSWHAAALRELAEEAGVWLLAPGSRVPEDDPLGEEVYRALHRIGSKFDARSLRFFSHWVTPPGLARRFDTRFFLAKSSPGSGGSADGTEVTDATWVNPIEALELSDEGTWDVPFPTRKHLEILGRFESPDAAVNWATELSSVPRIEPRIVWSDDGPVRVLLPGDPGYSERAP
jgi:8-oxo-dGTP pyrophosphatase MutT (NUDIX family)